MIQKNSANQIWYLTKLGGFFTSIGGISICFGGILCNASLFPDDKFRCLYTPEEIIILAEQCPETALLAVISIFPVH